MKINIRLKKIAAALIAVLIISSTLGMLVSAQGSLNGYVCDNAGVFSDAEEAALNSKIASKTELSDCDIYILTERKLDYDSGDDFIKQYGLSGNIILLVIYDNYAHNFDMFTYGSAFGNISDSEFDLILDHDTVYDNIKSGDYYDGALGFIDQSLKYYELSDGGRSTVSQYGFWDFFWFGIVVGLLTAIVTAICIICSYRRKLRSATYPLDRYARLDLKIRDDQFMGAFVTKRIIRTSSGGGGRSGGGGGFSGGGGRRGGR